MAFNERSLDDYIDVAERMTEFYDRGKVFPGHTRDERLNNTAVALELPGPLGSFTDLSHEQAVLVIGRLEARTEAKT